MRRLQVVLVLGVCATLSGCQSSGSGLTPPAGRTTPSYDPKTGRLQELVSDTNGDGKVDMRAQMDGARFKSVEIDRNGDGRPDRWEYYAQPAAASAPVAGASVLERAEESNAPDGRVTRREWYRDGVIARIEEDTDLDGRIDKWETYSQGALVQLDLDLDGKGVPTRRFVYGASGALDHLEVDTDGTGAFKRVAGPGPADSGKAPLTSARSGGGGA